MTDTVKFQHDGQRYTATLTQPEQDGARIGPAVWTFTTTVDGERTHVGLTVNDGELADALNHLAIRTAHQLELAQPHLDDAARAERDHALIGHLADKLGPPTEKSRSRKIR